jgi:lipoprotein-anchoring transpeptidase ErfK/SrfK
MTGNNVGIFILNISDRRDIMFREWMVAFAALGFCASAITSASALDMEAVNASNFQQRSFKSAKGADPVLIKAQVLLDRAGFSPGEIDGQAGENNRKAIAAFEAVHGLKADGQLNAEIWTRLTAESTEPVLTEYTIDEKDVKGPFLKKVPAKMEDMKDLDWLGYKSPLEALAERFHMSEALLKALNPGKSFDKSGQSIAVANVSNTAADGKVKRIEIDKSQRVLRAFDHHGDLIAVFPASIGSAEKPAPSGTFKVTGVARDPTYRYDPAYAFKGVHAKRPFTIKPGPNNPVGVVWISLSAKGYGIHGTPEPGKVSKTMSHGCIRLTNWDARKLAAMVDKGT